MLAADTGRTELVRLLIEAGADPDRRDAFGWVSLHTPADIKTQQSSPPANLTGELPACVCSRQ